MFYDDDLSIFFDDFAEDCLILSKNKTIKVLFDNPQTVYDQGFSQVIGNKPIAEVMNKDVAANAIEEDTQIKIKGVVYSVASVVDEGESSVLTLQKI